MKVAALIPARSGSQRIKDKNLKLLGEYPLLVRKIKQLQSSQVDEIFVGSNDTDYLKIAEKFGAIPILRTDFSCDEAVCTSNDMIEDFVTRVPDDFGIVLWAHCTNPFVYARHYDDALDLFQKEKSSYDSLMSVQKVQNHMWSSEIAPINYNPWDKVHTLAKDLEPVYFQTGGIFIQRSKLIRKNYYFFGEKPKFILHNKNEAIDIDTESDFLVAQNLVQFMDKKEGFVG